MTRSTLLLVAVSAVLLAGGCGDDGGADPVDPVPTVPVADASDHNGDVVVLEGFLVAAPGAPSLVCEALAESYPPQCGGSRIEVAGLEVSSLSLSWSGELETAGDATRWSDRPVRLTGRIAADELVVLHPNNPGLERDQLLVQAMVGSDPAVGATVELWADDGGVRSAVFDDLGIVVFEASGSGLEVVALPYGDWSAPPRVAARAGDAVIVQYLR